MNKFAFLLIIFLQLLWSCGSYKPVTDTPPKPEWVQSRPNRSDFYIGISAATKKGLSPDYYIATAKRNALSDLSSEISVNIETSSILNSMSDDRQFSQQFVDNIKTSNALQLEGYELVSTWEDAENYWVYYQLSKSGYATWKEQKKQQAISDSKNKFLQGQKMLDEKLHYNAFQFYAEALMLLSPYLNESTVCEIDHQSVDLGNTIYNSISNFLNENKFDVQSLDITIKKGVETDRDVFCFYLKDPSNKGVANMPVKVDFTGFGLLKNSEKTGNDGKFCCSFQKIKSTNSQEILTMAIDKNALTRSVTNHFVRSMIQNIPVSESRIRVVLQKPNLRITCNEPVLQDYLTDHLYSDFNMEVSSSSDFILNAVSDVKQKEKYNDLYYIELECVFTLNDSSGNNIYRKRIKEEYSGKDWATAEKNAYSEVKTMIDRSIKRDIVNCLN